MSEHPDKLLYAFLDIKGNVKESYTYKGFYHRTNNIASFIHSTTALKPGDRVLLAYPPGLEIICAFFACVRLGLIPVPVYPPSARGFDGCLKKFEASFDIARLTLETLIIEIFLSTTTSLLLAKIA